MIAWREKWRACSLHFLVTLAMAVAAAILIFFVWYPDPFDNMLGGSKFFLLVTLCDLVLGPLTSLIVYNSKKTRRALVFDYTFIAIVQLSAFVYGILSMADARPAYVAFVKDRLEVVLAVELDDKDLLDAKPPYNTRPRFGPRLVGTQRPTEREQINDLVMSAMEGKDLQNFPRYFVPYEANAAAIKEHARPLEELESTYAAAREPVADALAELKLPRERLRWLPVRTPKGYWTALLDAQTAEPLAYIPVDAL